MKLRKITLLFLFTSACVHPIARLSQVSKGKIEQKQFSVKVAPKSFKTEEASSCYPIITFIPFGWTNKMTDVNKKICVDQDTIYDAKYETHYKGFWPIFLMNCLEIQGKCEVFNEN